MAVKEIYLLGHPKLYEVCPAVEEHELEQMRPVIIDLHDTLTAFQKKYGIGRAIAAPQIGVMKRLVYMCIDHPVVFINPVLSEKSAEMMRLWDDCMSFPELLVKVERHQACTMEYRDLNWEVHRMELNGALAELLQHECDHLEGVLAVSRAVDPYAFALRSQQKWLQ